MQIKEDEAILFWEVVKWEELVEFLQEQFNIKD